MICYCLKLCMFTGAIIRNGFHGPGYLKRQPERFVNIIGNFRQIIKTWELGEQQ